MFGFRIRVKNTAVLLLALSVAGATSCLQAQSTRRRETNANREARIQHTIQETYSHRWEVAGGGGYLRFRSGQYLQKNNEVAFWTTTTYYFSEKLGVLADVRGLYGNAKIQNGAGIPGQPITLNFNPQISEYPLMGGVAYRLVTKEKFALSLTGEGGVAIGKFDGGSKGIPSQYLHVWQSAMRPVMSIGANFDYNFYPNLALRITPTWVGTTYQLDPADTAPQPHGSFQNNAGFNVGIVYRFGRIK
ncbi:hypothetical protein GCM10011507_29070 [Edaphobacter acidisoli]|uniref:Outer membrane protein beta-barrel domain-containing protein n=1 Tax=Edaphobacter acidisoli TaxID=2040573 RepID=A0A916RYS0_9BACT|nr:hypothetical protein [Edaphobacter acidisoli]GGA75882.1 hypothetical protein GCM10011507_29070 [Edaphobacter acidisoli]